MLRHAGRLSPEQAAALEGARNLSAAALSRSETSVEVVVELLMVLGEQGAGFAEVSPCSFQRAGAVMP
jgi:hypothetical protein